MQFWQTILILEYKCFSQIFQVWEIWVFQTVKKGLIFVLIFFIIKGLWSLIYKRYQRKWKHCQFTQTDSSMWYNIGGKESGNDNMTISTTE